MRALLLVVVALVSAVAVAFLLPSLKEGYGIEEFPTFGGVLVALIVLGVMAWRGLRPRPLLLVAGLTCLALPVLAYGFLTVTVLVHEWRGRMLTRSARITSLRETLIEWPGFDRPVGLRLEIELEHGVRMAGILYPPKVGMAEAAVPTRDDYFFGSLFGGSRAPFLQAPVFQDVGRPDAGPALQESPARLSFDLYPSRVHRYEAGRKVCFGAAEAEPAGLGASGQQLGAAWMFVSRGGVYVDLSAPLTAELRRTSRFEGERAEWERLLRQLEPEALLARGFAACADDKGGGRCYCAEAAGQWTEAGRGSSRGR